MGRGASGGDAVEIWSGYVARAVSNDEQCLGGSPADIADAQQETVALRTWKAKAAKLDEPGELLRPLMPW